MKTIPLLFFLFSVLSGDLPVTSTTTLGPIEFTVLKNGESNRRYIWLHGDEKTAEMAIKEHIQNFKGTAFLINNDERVVHIDGLRLDPNRIFSTRGIKKTLHKYHPKSPSKKRAEIVGKVERGRKSFLQELSQDDEGLVVAVHNNSRGFSMDSVLGHATDSSVKSDQSRRDFYICTNESDYEVLSKSPYNAVLLKNGSEEYDGSLSSLMAKKEHRFVNVEVRLGWLSQQRKMLKYIEAYLP